MTDKKTEALKLALEALENLPEMCGIEEAITAVQEALAEQPAQQEPEPDRVKFERHWRKTRGDKKANRELPRHPLQPQTYIQDSANRHWVTWQAAVRSVSPQPAQQEPVAYASDVEFDDETEIIPAEQKGKLGTAGLRIPLYIDPPASKPWVGLTDQEFQWIYDNGRTPAGMMELTEAKLREKNA